MVSSSPSLYFLRVWGHACGGQLGRLSVPDNATASSMLFWSGNDVPLCSQLVLLAVMHIPLLLTSAFYMGEYSRLTKDRPKSRILQSLLSLSLLFFLISLTNFLYLFLYTRSNQSYILLSFLIIKLLTWLSHTFCLVHLVYARGYKEDRTPPYSMLYWLIVLLSTSFFYRSLLTYQIRPGWYGGVDATFLEGNFFLYTMSIELFLHILYGFAIILSYFKVRILVFLHKRRTTDPLSQSLLSIQHSYGSLHRQDPELPARPVNEESANWFSYLFFSWFNQTVNRGYKKKIGALEDLPSLPKNLEGSRLIARFDNYYTDKLLFGKKLNK